MTSLPPPLQPGRSYNEPTTPPRCIACAYVISGLGEHTRCPECGRGFNLHDPSTFTYRRPFVGWKYWATGLAIAAAAGIASIAIDVLALGAGGSSVWIVTPAIIGFVCGYYVRVKVYALGLLCLALFGCIMLGLASMNIAGVFCGLILAGIAIVPIFVGALLGHGARAIIKARGYNLRKPLVLMLAIGASVACAWIEKLAFAPAQPRTVSTSLDIDRPIEVCWDSVMFYEEVRHDPPLILRIGLARPIRTEGSCAAVGDKKICIYNNGQLVKQTTAVRPPEQLEFSVVDQHIGYERDVRLISGSFVLERMAPARTRVKLSTTYQPLLGPRWAWAWGEDYAMHTLHGHVLEGMRRHATEPARSVAAGTASQTGGTP